MACLQISRSGLSPTLGLISTRSRHRRRPSALPFRSRLDESGSESIGEEPPESLFMKELKRRGMSPTSLREDSSRGFYGEKDMEEKEESGTGKKNKAKRNGVVSAEYDKGSGNQRDRSMALNSEGLEGLIPRAKLLLTIGGSFFLGFWPFILITTTLFAALYFYFGSSFVHDATKLPGSPPPYIDPYALLEDESISQIASRIN